GAGLEPEIAILVHEERVAGDVPAIDHIVLLALVGEVAAAGGPAYGELADGTGWQGPEILVQHAGFIARHRFASGAGADIVAARRNEDMDHLGGADAVDDADAGLALPILENALGEMLARRKTFAQAALPAFHELWQQ